MSEISDFIDNLNFDLDELYGATHLKLVNPYTITMNDNKILNRGYGWRIGPGSVSDLGLNHFITVQRELVLLNTVVNRGSERDISIREGSEKTLLEDQLNGVGVISRVKRSCGIIDIEYQSDGGITFVFDDREQFLLMETSFVITQKVEIDYCSNVKQ